MSNLSSIGKILIAGLCSSVLLSNIHAKEEYDAQKIADIFYTLNGDKNNPHKKINHTKGFCAIGEFLPAKGITKTLDIPLLSQKSIPTQVRFSLGGGNPNASDKSKARGLALKLNSKTDNWEMVVLNTEINFSKNPKEFWEFFAMKVPKNGKVDTKNIQKRTQQVASFRNYEAYLAKMGITSSVANTMYHSIHTFFVKDSKTQEMLPARFKFVPTNGVSYLNQDELKTKDDNFLESDAKAKLAKKPIEYKMVLVFANPNDVTNDTTALWSGEHKELEVGTLRVKKYDGTDCNGDVFMPGVLPSGVGEPQDLLFDLRIGTYVITFGRRQ